jgi:ketosteroid isomerase-like protein
MKKCVFLLMFLVAGITSMAQPLSPSEKEFFTRQMTDQQKNWNLGDIDGYMAYYWGSDSLMFVSKGTVRKGWQNIRDNYEKKYPDAEHMGTLEYSELYFYKLDKKKVFCTGAWKINRNNEVLSGTFTLIWVKIKSRWVITMDHTE